MPRTQQLEVDLETSGGLVRLPVRVARRKGIKHLRVAVDLYNDVTLNIPPRLSLARGMAFLRDQADWVCEVMRKSPTNLSLLEHLRSRTSVSGLGRAFALALETGPRARSRIDLEAFSLCLTFDPAAPIEPQLVRGLRHFAGVVIPRRVQFLANVLGQSYQRISVRDQRSRWGSCSGNQGLSFNWRLVLLEPALHDHLIYHELAHLTHLNHSRAFWDLVRRYDPALDRHDRAITEASDVLMRLGRSGSAQPRPIESTTHAAR